MKKVIRIIIVAFITSFPIWAQCGYSESEFKTYLDNNQNVSVIEGIWTCNILVSIFSNGELIKSEQADDFIPYYIKRDYKLFSACMPFRSTGYNFLFKPTATEGLYLCQVDLIEHDASTSTTATLRSNGIIELSFRLPDQALQSIIDETLGSNPNGKRKQYRNLGLSATLDVTLIKTYPTDENETKSLKSSGTGFALSVNGILVTNYHIVENATRISIRGVNEDFNNSLVGKVLVVDRSNDLALVQIIDSSFKGLQKIPYTFASTNSKVGESVYVLGYPLKAALGEEIKLTNGIISSKTGFQGDATSYQISAPVQPGNSGGPLFDMNGSVIGIINAKFAQGENISYAIKSFYLTNLIDLSPVQITLPTVNILKEMSLPEQVEHAKDFIYIIEIN